MEMQGKKKIGKWLKEYMENKAMENRLKPYLFFSLTLVYSYNRLYNENGYSDMTMRGKENAGKM